MLKHEHLIIRAEILTPPLYQDVDKMNLWFKDLIESIGMKILLGPYTVYSHMKGNRGFTGICAIETSSITMHVWDEDSPGFLNLDVYTCSSLNINTVVKKLQEFNPVKIEYIHLDRDNEFRIKEWESVYLKGKRIKEMECV